MESIPEAWERLQEYILACPHHGMDEWLVLQSFYNRLTTTSRANIDAAAGGAFLDLTIVKSKVLVEKMVSNQGWSDEQLQPRTKGMHTIMEADMIVAKLDLPIKKMEEESKQQIHAPIYAMGLHFTCEVCGNDGHSMTVPRPVKTTHTSTTGIVHNKEGRGGTSRVHHSREVTTITQISIRIPI